MNKIDRLLALEAKVKQILLQTGDDPCWMDWGRLYPELAELCNIKDYKPKLLPKEEMLRNCKKSVDSLSSTETEYISEGSLLIINLFEKINNAHIQIAEKLNWDMYINPNDVEWRLALANAIDKVFEKFNKDS